MAKKRKRHLNTGIATEGLEKLVELTKHVAGQSQRKNSNAAALEKAREQIEQGGQFVPKIDPPVPVKICF